MKIDFILIRWEGLCWINLAKDRGKWQAVVNIILTVKLRKMREISGIAE
jgi:hypothetical protein